MARARELTAQLEEALAGLLDADSGFTGDPALLAALLIAAYRATFVAAARRRLAGESAEDVAVGHLDRLAAAFRAVEPAEEPPAGS